MGDTLADGPQQVSLALLRALRIARFLTAISVGVGVALGLAIVGVISLATK